MEAWELNDPEITSTKGSRHSRDTTPTISPPTTLSTRRSRISILVAIAFPPRQNSALSLLILLTMALTVRTTTSPMADCSSPAAPVMPKFVPSIRQR